MTPTYSAADLQHLEGLDAVRKRPGMYIGSTDSRGLVHLVWEIIDNSVDEALAGHCDRIDVKLHPDGSYEVSDNGRGIPTDINEASELSGVELVFTKLHAGGKFGSSGYKVSGGLHGVGASVVNALSERLDVEVVRADGVWEGQFAFGDPGSFSKSGVFTGGPALRQVKKSRQKKTGTTVRFWPDSNLFVEGSTVDFNQVVDRAKTTAFLVPGLELVIEDLRADATVAEPVSFRSLNGLTDLIIDVGGENLTHPPIRITGEASFTERVPVLTDGKMVTTDVERDMEVEVALAWSNGFDTSLRSFANIVSTPKGGTHVTGFERALSKTVSDACVKLKTTKANDEAPNKDDVMEGLIAAVSVKFAEPQFEGQTKEILGTPAAQKIVSDIVARELTAMLANKKFSRHAKTICSKVSQAAKTRRQLRLQRETIRRKNALESSSLPAKLADCRSSDMERTELVLLEGDSAMGSAKAARDSEIQALLPLRGKILNTLRASEKQMLDNNECAAIVAALGAGAGKSFDVDSVRYGRVVILVDADVDGSHIRVLLLTLFFQYMRPLLEEGRVFAATPPLFKIDVKGDEPRYAYSDAERDRILVELAAANKKISQIARFKGLGEMSATQLSETTLDPAGRVLRRVTIDDAAEAAAMFEVLMGSTVAPRKAYITENALAVDPDSLDF